MFGELVTGVCLARAAWGTARLIRLRREIARAEWPIITSAADAVPKAPSIIACSQLQPNCKAIVFNGPEKQEVVQPVMVMVGHVAIPIGGGEIETSEGDPDFTCVLFNTPHNPQRLFNFAIEDMPQPKSRFIQSDEEHIRTLDKWGIPHDQILNRIPRLVKEKEFGSSTPLYCISGPNYSGVSPHKSMLSDRMLLNNRGALFITSWFIGIGGAFMYFL